MTPRYLRRRWSPEVLTQFLQINAVDAVLSVVTYGELVYGMVKWHSPPLRQAVEQLDEFTSLIGLMPIPIEAGRRYGEIRSALKSKGQLIGSNNMWIAAHAISANLALVTNNERELRRGPALKIENWTR